jgi:hypothetical protein
VDFAVENQRRFWAKVDRSGGDGACWPWIGARNAKGYGLFHLGIRSQRAHRVAYEMVHGEICGGMLVCHRCDTPPCVNPTHLFLGTDADNLRDSFAKGRRRNDGEHHPRARLTAADVERIRLAAEVHGPDHSWRGGLARELGISRKYIQKIVSGECWAVRP